MGRRHFWIRQACRGGELGTSRKRSGLVSAASRNELWLLFLSADALVPIRTDSEELNYETRKSGGLVKLWVTNQSEGSQLADSL